MKKILALTLVFAMMLGGCGSKAEKPEPTLEPVSLDSLIEANGRAPEEKPAEAAAEAEIPAETEAAITAPTEPQIHRNPVNGTILDAPFTGRLHGHTISNMQENMPHVNLCKADIVVETYVNMNNIIRCLAIYSDIASVEAIGSTRSTRPMFNDIAQHYSLIVSHAGGSDTALEDATSRGIQHFNIEDWNVQQQVTTSYRDTQYNRSLENSLFGIGSGIVEYAKLQGWPMTMERDYGFRFTENGTPANGEAASRISLNFRYKEARKDTFMVYDSELGKYVWNQYGKEMTDQITGEKEAFTNVLILDTTVTNNGIYHAADFLAGGTGYYANGGLIAPITWTCDGDTEPLKFFAADGNELLLGVGNTYMAIAPTGSPVTWEA